MKNFFCKPGTHAVEGTLAFKGTPKIYKMGWIREGGFRFHHIEVESYPQEGVVVHYLITGRTYSWEWKHREEAWDFAQTRKLHVQTIGAGGY